MTRTLWAGLPRAAAVLALLTGSAAIAQAQNATIQGKVTTDQGRPIEGANIFITEMNLSVGSNAAGNFTITVPGARVRGQSVTLRARSIGMKPDAKPIVLRPGVINQNFVLAADVNRLSQVVVTGVAGATEQTAVHQRMQGFDAAVQHLGEPCELGHLGHGQPCVGQQPGCAASGNEIDAQCMQCLGQFEDAGFVGDGDEGVHGVGLGWLAHWDFALRKR